MVEQFQGRVIASGGVGDIISLEFGGREVVGKVLNGICSERFNYEKSFNLEAKLYCELSFHDAFLDFIGVRENVEIELVDRNKSKSEKRRVKKIILLEKRDDYTLRNLINRKGKRSVLQVAQIGAQISGGLLEMHDRGYVHRDIKHGNVLYDVLTDKIKIIDFGYSCSKKDSSLNAYHRIIGTASFKAPETFFGIDDDTRSDLYSLGVILLESYLQQQFIEKMSHLDWKDKYGSLPYLSELSKIMCRELDCLRPSISDVKMRCLNFDFGNFESARVNYDILAKLTFNGDFDQNMSGGNTKHSRRRNVDDTVYYLENWLCDFNPEEKYSLWLERDGEKVRREVKAFTHDKLKKIKRIRGLIYKPEGELLGINFYGGGALILRDEIDGILNLVVEDDLRCVFRKLLEVDRSKRYQSARDVKEDFDSMVLKYSSYLN
jgi:serine/threonine protein kinase